jgi:hypothetical protein
VGFSKSYHGTTNDLPEETLATVIRSIDKRTYTMVLMAGGEPSLSPALIRVGIRLCREMELLSAIVSAPIWAASPQKAADFLDTITGLSMLILSYDTYHLEFLKWEHYRNAALAALSRSMRIVFQIAFTHEEERNRMIKSLRGLAVVAQIHPMRTVMVGNAAKGSIDVELTQVSDESDLDRIPKGCVLGNAFVDNDLKVHGCCWSTATEASPFTIPVEPGGTDVVRQSFVKLENAPGFQAVRKSGFLGALSPKGRREVVRSVKGECFSCECDICMRLMRNETREIWTECR